MTFDAALGVPESVPSERQHPRESFGRRAEPHGVEAAVEADGFEHVEQRRPGVVPSGVWVRSEGVRDERPADDGEPGEGEHRPAVSDDGALRVP